MEGILIKYNDNLKIRSAILSDMKYLLNWWNDGKVMEHAGFPLGLKTTEARVSENIKSQSKKRAILIIEFEGVIIGEMNYNLVTNSVAEIGIKICDFSKQNQGIGTKCLYLLIDFLFNTKKVEKIILDTNLKNKRAQKVYERIGFKKVKVEIDSWENQLGELQSTVFYELEKNHWNLINDN